MILQLQSARDHTATTPEPRRHDASPPRRLAAKEGETLAIMQRGVGDLLRQPDCCPRREMNTLHFRTDTRKGPIYPIGAYGTLSYVPQVRTEPSV